MTKRKLALAVALAAVGSVWTGAASAAEKSESMNTYELAPVEVEGQRAATETTSEGNFVARGGSVGILGDKDTMETPFTTTNVTQETIKSFGDPSQPLDSVLAISPSVRATGSVLHNDFQLRGFRSNGSSSYVNGIPDMFTQFRAWRGRTLTSHAVSAGTRTGAHASWQRRWTARRRSTGRR